MTLLENINAEIKYARGRTRLANAIICESPEWFNYDTRQDIKDRVAKLDYKDRNKVKKATWYELWSPEDKQFVLDNYGKMKTPSIAKILNRSVRSIRQLFKRFATKDQRKWAFTEGRYKGMGIKKSIYEQQHNSMPQL